MKFDIKGFFSKSIIPIAIIYFALFFDFFLQEGFVVVRKDLEKKYGWEEHYLNDPLGLGKFVMMACCPIIAYASSRFAAHHIFVLGLVSLVLCTITYSFSDSLALFSLARSFHGISSPSMMLSGMAILTHLSEKTSRGKYASYGYSGIAHGILLAPLCLGRLMSNLGQQNGFLLITGLIVLNTIAAVIHFYNITMFWDSPNTVHDEDDKISHKSSTSSFHPITGNDVLSLLRIILSNPRMITAVSSCFLVGISIGANESVLIELLDRRAPEFGLNDTHVELIWTGGSITYSIFAVLSGYLADHFSPLKLVFIGMVGFTITYSFMALACSSMVGLIVFIAVTGGLTSYLDVAAYPLISSVVDTADIPNAYIIGYSIEYCLEQGAYAIGHYTGEPLYEAAQSLAPIAIMVASVDGFLLAFGLFVCFVYPADRFVIKPSSTSERGEEEEEIKPTTSCPGDLEDGSTPTIAEEL